MEMEQLIGRVSMLEKLLTELAKWTNFDLQEFSKLQKSDDINETRVKQSSHTRTEKRERLIDGNVQRQNAVAKKSTSGVKRNKSSRRGSPRRLARDVNNEDDDKLEIKEEIEFVSTEDNEYDEFLYIPDNLDIQEVEEDDEYQQPASSQEEDEEIGNDDEELEDSSKPKNPPKRKSADFKLWRYKPLRILPKSKTQALDITIKMDKLEPNDLLKYNVKIPPPRRTKGHWPCNECDEFFSSRSHLANHHKIHKTKKPKKQPKALICPYCSKIDYLKSRHQLHLRTHTKEKPFLCYQCGFATKSQGILTNHQKTKHSEEPRQKIQCDKCELKFSSKSNLKLHQRKKHGENGVNAEETKCDLCNKAFIDLRHYNIHVREVHQNLRSFTCHLCGQKFKRGQHLKAHLIRHANPDRRKRGPQIPYPFRHGLEGFKKISEDEEDDDNTEEKCKNPLPQENQDLDKSLNNQTDDESMDGYLSE